MNPAPLPGGSRQDSAGSPTEALLVELLRCADPVSAAQPLVRLLAGSAGAAALWRIEDGATMLLAAIAPARLAAVEEGFVDSKTLLATLAARPGCQARLHRDSEGAELLLAWLDGERRAPDAWLLDLALERIDELAARQRLYGSLAELAEAERVQRAIYRIADLAGAGLPMQALFAELHRIVAALMYAENFYIALYEPATGLLRFPYFVDVLDANPPLPDEALPIETLAHSLTATVVLGGEPLRGPPQQINRQLGGRLELIGPDAVDWLGVPLRLDGQVVGALVVQSYSEHARYDAAQQALLSYVAQHIATAIARAQAQRDLERRVNERTEALRQANAELRLEIAERQRAERLQAALFRIAEIGATADSLEAFYAAVHEIVAGLLYARNFYIALLAEDQQRLLFPYQVDEFDADRQPRLLGRGLTEYVLRTATPLLADRATIRRLRESQEVVGSGTESECWLGVPLICGEQTVGVIAVQSYDHAHQYDSRDQELLTFVAFHIANALERKRAADSLRVAYAELEQRVAERTRALFEANRILREQIAERERIERQLKHETLHDGLTGLPNRALLLERLAQAMARCAGQPRERFAVLFLDLDRFKVINDSVGHLVGDELLRQAGARISACLRGSDIVARLGGDEFAILAESVSSVDEVLMLGQRVLAALDQPFRLHGRELFTSSSIGIALSNPSYARPEELLRDADAAMYEAKAQGRRRVEVFDEKLHRRALLRLELENDLRLALQQRQFEPWYQPVACLSSGRLIGFEALARWRHPRRGLLKPVDFIVHAEDSGQIEQLDWQILDAALAQFAAWTRRYPAAEAMFLSVNFSGVHFHALEFPARLAASLAARGVAPSRLRLEVIERALLEQPQIVNRVLSRLRGLGVSVSLDDFGTGYSSLSYLQQYRLDALKIDQSFVRGLSLGSGGSAVIVKAILSIAQALDMQVIAEGIETAEERRQLVELGCRYGQGFELSSPCPPERIELMLAGGPEPHVQGPRIP